MIIHGKDGWPVERIIGRPIQNFLRAIIHGNLRMTWTRRHETYGHDPRTGVAGHLSQDTQNGGASTSSSI